MLDSPTIITQVVAPADQEAEQALLEKAIAADSKAAWLVGQYASEWTESYARGRTDADFAKLTNSTRETVNKRRRVWERFGDWSCRTTLSFSHFREAVSWDDADECIEWAIATDATVNEMVAWRNLRLGNDPKTTATVPTADAVVITTHAAEPDAPVVVPDWKPPTPPPDLNVPHMESHRATDSVDVFETATMRLRQIVNEMRQLSTHLNDLNTSARHTIADELTALAEQFRPTIKATDHDFEKFWQKYPRRKGKGAARRAYSKAAKAIGIERLTAATAAFANDCEKGLRDGRIQGPQYIPHAATWLNGERWDDEPDAPVSATGKTEQTIGTLANWLRQTADDSHGHDEANVLNYRG